MTMSNVAIKKAHGETAVGVVASIVSAEAEHRHSSKKADLHLCAFGQKRMFRRFDLPAGIDTDNVHARLADGLLKISARKLEQETPKAAAVSAA
jgi:HSP20 family molecular chaperone IbpA